LTAYRISKGFRLEHSAKYHVRANIGTSKLKVVIISISNADQISGASQIYPVTDPKQASYEGHTQMCEYVSDPGELKLHCILTNHFENSEGSKSFVPQFRGFLGLDPASCSCIPRQNLSQIQMHPLPSEATIRRAQGPLLVPQYVHFVHERSRHVPQFPSISFYFFLCDFPLFGGPPALTWTFLSASEDSINIELAFSMDGSRTI
jgi:hypothetical protein